MDIPQLTVEFLTASNLTMVTAESCTGGRIAALLTEAAGCGNCLECGYVSYSPKSKLRELGVEPSTIQQFGLTSEEVAVEMARGALFNSGADIAVATTGLIGDEPMDGIAPGTVWFAWLYQTGDDVAVVTRKEIFAGSRKEVQLNSSLYALEGVMQLRLGESHKEIGAA